METWSRTSSAPSALTQHGEEPQQHTPGAALVALCRGRAVFLHRAVMDGYRRAGFRAQIHTAPPTSPQPMSARRHTDCLCLDKQQKAETYPEFFLLFVPPNPAQTASAEGTQCRQGSFILGNAYFQRNGSSRQFATP